MRTRLMRSSKVDGKQQSPQFRPIPIACNLIERIAEGGSGGYSGLRHQTTAEDKFGVPTSPKFELT